MPFTCARKIQSWMFFDHRVPPCVLDVPTVISKYRRATRLKSVGKKSVLGVISVGFSLSIMLWIKRNEHLIHQVCVFLNLWLVTFATSASSLTVGRLAPQLPTEMVDIIILVWCTYFLLSGPHTERYRYTLYVLCLHGLSGEDSEWTFSPVRLICLLGQWDVIASSSHVK